MKYEVEFIRDEKKSPHNETLVFGETNIKGIAEKCFKRGRNETFKTIKVRRIEKNENLKIIDILNIISRGGKPPKKIRYNLLQTEFDILIFDENEKEYRFERDYNEFWRAPNHHLNDKIEIIEF